MAYKNKKSFSVISTIIVIMLIMFVIGFAFKFTNGFNEDFKTFYVTINGKDILSSGNGYQISETDSLKVDVKYVFGTYNEEDTSYSVKVKANPSAENNFSFSVDGFSHTFSQENDLTAGFIIDKSEQSFTIKAKGSLNDILQAVYPNKQISDCSDYEYNDMFILTVSSYNGQASVNIYFSLHVTITGITLDPLEVIF